MAAWYYARNDQQRGPVSADTLRAMAASGELRPTDMIWNESMPDWVRAESVREVFSERRSYQEPLAALPVHPRRPREDYLDDDDDFVPRRRGSYRRQHGMSTGAKV